MATITDTVSMDNGPGRGRKIIVTFDDGAQDSFVFYPDVEPAGAFNARKQALLEQKKAADAAEAAAARLPS